MSEDYDVRDYNAKLRKDYEEIRDKVERGMLPLVARIPAIEKAVSDYVIARDEHLAQKKNPPIAFRDADALHRFADLILYEELTWSHPDKMSIVEYPVMSDVQLDRRHDSECPKGEVEYGDRRGVGRKKTSFTDDYGAPQVRNSKLPSSDTEGLEMLVERLDLREAIALAGLTERQEQAIRLVYVEDMTQERAGEIMGVSKSNVNEYIKHGIAKIRRGMSE